MALRADKFTQISKKQEYFSDFLTNFDKHPVNNSLAKVTNEESIKQSVRNLILTNFGERLFEPDIGSGIRAALFEPNDIVTAQSILFHINSTISQNESRVNLLDVSVVPSIDESAFSVSIVFSIINNTAPITLNLILRRVR